MFSQGPIIKTKFLQKSSLNNNVQELQNNVFQKKNLLLSNQMNLPLAQNGPPNTNIPKNMNMNNYKYAQMLQLRFNSMNQMNLPVNNIPKQNFPPYMYPPNQINPGQLVPSNPTSVNDAMRAKIQSENTTTIPNTNNNCLSPSTLSQSSTQKEGIKSKPSEFETNSLKIGNYKVNNHKISTKIQFGKKLFVWELTEQSEDSEVFRGKKKIEISFNDVSQIEINTENSSLLIEAKNKPKEFKELNHQPKKSTQWTKQSSIFTGNDGKPYVFEENKPIQIFSTFRKDIFNKSVSGKNSHLDKLKSCDLPLIINGKSAKDSINNTPIKQVRSFENSAENIQKMIPLSPAIFNYHDEYITPQQRQYLIQNSNNRNGMMNNSGPNEINSKQNGLNSINNFDNFDSISNFNNKDDLLSEPSMKMDQDNFVKNDNEEEEIFPLITEKQIEEYQTFMDKSIKKFSDTQKVDIISNTFKIKKQPPSFFANKKFICPYFKCFKAVQTQQSLKSHLKKHNISENFVEVNANGNLECSTAAIDFVLMLSKIYPKFVKNMMKEHKKGKL